MPSNRTVQTTSFNVRGKEVTISGRDDEYIFGLVRRDSNFYERDLLDIIATLPLRDGHIVDVGANIGNHTVYFGTFFENPILAVEPVGSNFELLARNIHDNNLTDRVKPVQSVVWDGPGLFTMDNHNPSNGGTFHARPASSSPDSVIGQTLAEIVGDKAVALLKVDVEGAEDKVIAGGLSIIRRDRPIVVAESHSPEAYRQLAALLMPEGYEVVAQAGRSTNYLWAHSESLKSESTDQLRHRLEIDSRNTTARQAMTSLDRITRNISTNGAAAAARDSEILEATRGTADSVRAIEETIAALHPQEAHKAEQKLHDQLQRATVELARALEDREGFEIAATSWQRAYAHLATRWESSSPGAISATAAMESVREVIASSGGVDVAAPAVEAPSSPIRELDSKGLKRTESVRIGIATMPGREKGLKAVVEALLPQADEIFIYLNGMEQAPAGIAHDSRVRFFTGPDYGDRGKFRFMEDFTGYYFTCDDDIEYPDFYVDYMVDAIERYGRKAIVGWHGSIFSDDFEDYYNSKYRRVLSFSMLRGQDTPVHLLGTGIAGFHTSTMPVNFEDFEYPNMADAFLARLAQRHKVPMVVLRHEKGWALPIDAQAPSISNVSLGKSVAVKEFDVRGHVSKLVKDHGKWELNFAEPVLVREKLSVAIIGRTDKERWKKGGILKSCHLTASMLRQFGAQVVLEDIETGDPENCGGAAVSVVMIYVGDPDRPDFAKVEKLIDLHALKGRTVVVNLSVNGKSSRNENIRQRLLSWEQRHGDRVVLMVFTESMVDHPELADVRHLVVPIPKTLLLPSPPAAEFHTTKGIFVGDIAKLSDDSLMTHPAKDWLAAIRRAVPEAPIYGVRQYIPRHDVPLDVDEVWPFLNDDFSEKISATRLMVTPIKYATFEMVPVEVASLGVPVIYQEMPQSLSEYLGLAGVRVDTPEELEAVLPMLYRDPLVWRSQSRAGRLRAQSADLQSAAGQMYMRLAVLAKRAAI